MTIVKQNQLNHKQTIASASSASSSSSSSSSPSLETSRKGNTRGSLNSTTKNLNSKNVSGEQQTANLTKTIITTTSSNNTSSNLNCTNFKAIRGHSKRCLLCYKLLSNVHGNTLNRGHSLLSNHLSSRNANLVNQFSLQSNQFLLSKMSIGLRELLSESKNGLLLMNYLEKGNTHCCDDCFTHLKQIDYHMNELDNLKNLFETKMNKTCKVICNSSVSGHKINNNINNKLGVVRKIIRGNRLLHKHAKRNNTLNGKVKRESRRAEVSIELINKKKNIERLKILANSQHNYHQKTQRQHDESEQNNKINKKQQGIDEHTVSQELDIQDQQGNENETSLTSLPILSKDEWTDLFQKNPEIHKRLSNQILLNPLLYTLSNDSASALLTVLATLGAAASTNKPVNSNLEIDIAKDLQNGHMNPQPIENPQPTRSKRKPANPSRLFKNENGIQQQEGEAEGADLKDKQEDNYNIGSEKENKRNLYNVNINNNGIKRNNHSQELTQQSTKAKSEKLHISSRNDNRFGTETQFKSNRNEQLNRFTNKENDNCTDGDELGVEHDELNDQTENHMDNDIDEGDYYGNNQINGDMDISAEYDEDDQDNEEEEMGNEEQEQAYEDEDEYDDENPSAQEPTTEDDELTYTHKAYQNQYNKQHSSFNHRQARNKNGLKPSKINSTINSDEENEGFDDFEDTNSANNKPFRKANKVFANHKINGSISPSSSSTKHPCTQCKKTFKTQNILRQHMRIHTGDKPFVCEICNKAFSQMASLKYHSATHSDDRPYKCSNCPKTFKLKPPYKKHVKECQPKSNNQVSSTSSSFSYSSIKV